VEIIEAFANRVGHCDVGLGLYRYDWTPVRNCREPICERLVVASGSAPIGAGECVTVGKEHERIGILANPSCAGCCLLVIGPACEPLPWYICEQDVTATLDGDGDVEQRRRALVSCGGVWWKSASVRCPLEVACDLVPA
jgi:hypothetical protein